MNDYQCVAFIVLAGVMTMLSCCVGIWGSVLRQRIRELSERSADQDGVQR